MRDLCTIVHPDFWGNKSKKEGEKSSQDKTSQDKTRRKRGMRKCLSCPVAPRRQWGRKGKYYYYSLARFLDWDLLGLF